VHLKDGSFAGTVTFTLKVSEGSVTGLGPRPVLVDSEMVLR